MDTAQSDRALDAKAEGVLRVLSDTSARAAAFTRAAGLACPVDCGACCRNPRVTTTSLEMLPAAVMLLASGRAEKLLATLREGGEGGEKLAGGVCALFDGRCSLYPGRPLVCRLFGSGARRSAHGKREFLGCALLREAADPAAVSEAIDLAPVAGESLGALLALDPSDAVRELPINDALRFALERVLLDDSYR